MKNYKTIFTILLLLTTVTASYGQSESQESTMELMEREIAHKMSAIYNRSELKNGYYTRRYYTEHQTQSSFKTFVRLFVSENERIQFKGPFKR